MELSIAALMERWAFYPASTAALLAIVLPYAFCWARLRRARADLATFGRLLSFALGAAALGLAFLSPIAALQQELLIGRAAQQILVGLLAPPLLWLASPFHIVTRALPAGARRRVVGNLKRSTRCGRLIRRATHPFGVWILALCVFMLWHEPAIANRLLVDPVLYRLGLWGVWISYMLFWWHPIGAGPRLRPAMPPIVAFLYVIIGGEAPNMVTGVTLAFRRTPAYDYYAERVAAQGLTVMQDQMISGGMIWLLGSVVYFGVAVALLGRVFRAFEAPPPPPISWDATERTIAPGLEHRVLGQRHRRPTIGG